MEDRTQGQWNAYVEKSKTREEVYEKLEEVPISMRDNARRHLQTIWAIKKYHDSQKSKK